jgi:hypothetical protein
LQAPVLRALSAVCLVFHTRLAPRESQKNSPLLATVVGLRGGAFNSS